MTSATTTHPPRRGEDTAERQRLLQLGRALLVGSAVGRRALLAGLAVGHWEKHGWGWLRLMLIIFLGFGLVYGSLVMF